MWDVYVYMYVSKIFYFLSLIAKIQFILRNIKKAIL